MTALVADAELPPKIGVHPRPDGSFAHAMPAYLRGADAGRRGRPARDQVGRRASRTNAASGCRRSTRSSSSTTQRPACRSRSSMAGRSPRSGRRPSPASRSRRFAPAVAGRPPRAALIGAGVQGHSHLPVLGHVLPGRPARRPRPPPGPGRRARREAARRRRGSAAAASPPTARDAVAGADVVVTAASFAPPAERQVDDRGLARARRPGRRRRLRHDARRRGRPRRGPVPRRRPRPVPGEPRRRASSTATRTRRRRSARRSWRGTPRPATGRVVVDATSASGSPTSSSATRSCAARRGASGIGLRAAAVTDRPTSSWSAPGRWAPGPRCAAQRAGLDDDPHRRVRGRATRGRRRATRPGSSARRTARTGCTRRWSRDGPRRLDRARRARSARRSSCPPGRSGSPTARTASRRASAATLRGWASRSSASTPAEVAERWPQIASSTTWPSPSTSPRRAC